MASSSIRHLLNTQIEPIVNRRCERTMYRTDIYEHRLHR
ncbi:hypothetical protein Rrhod_1724 [Rhodococcus rhodnii LMG 5362]|uniref:Transposase n=1 Tax=Rhodococcus rhodnii LMG 5362 TaxID=1273125 RepID=R7WNC8_9NOCA|nr:hypothetical protein Rrhod_1724 [Rhodococcus rhodnii LMG 5362]